MEEYDFCEELKNVYKHSMFDNDSIRYYINGFIDALGIEINEGKTEWVGFSDIIDNKKNKYVSDVVFIYGDDYEIKVMKNIGKKKNWLKVEGTYQNLYFSLDNFFNDRKIRNKNINNLPFEISISCMEEDNNYCLKILEKDLFTYFWLNDDYHNIFFGVRGNRIEYIWGILTQFVTNPKKVFQKYQDIIDRENVVYSVSKIDAKVLSNDIILDKNGKKLEKVLK